MTYEEAIDIVMNHKEEDGLYRLPDGLGDATYIIRQLEKSYSPKLQIPKRMAEILDTDGLDSDSDDDELDYWIIPNIPDGKDNYRRALCEIYVASKVIGVELIEVVE